MLRSVSRTSLVFFAVVTTACLGLKDCGDDPTGPTSNLTVACSGTPTNGNPPFDVRFTAAARGVTGKDDQGVTYRWDFGDGTVASVANLTKAFTMGGAFKAKVTAKSGSREGVCEVAIQSNSDLRIDGCSAEPRQGQAPLAVQFKSRVVGSGQNPINYAWTFGDGGSAGSAEPAYTYQSAGEYGARLVASSGGSTVQCTVPVGVYTPLAVTCSASPTSGDAPLTVSFDADAAGQSGCTYAWDFGDSETSTQKNPSHRYQYGGVVTPKVVVTCGLRQGACEQRLSYTPVPKPTPAPTTPPGPGPTATPTPTPSGPCYTATTFVGTGTPITANWDADPSLYAPVTVTGLPTPCRVREVRWTIHLDSVEDFAVASAAVNFAIYLEATNGTAHSNPAQFLGNLWANNLPTGFSGTALGTRCGGLVFDWYEANFATAVPPYNGVFSPGNGSDFFAYPTANMNGTTYSLGVKGTRASAFTLNCWQMEVITEPIP